MSKTVRELFERWERVWHDGEFDLVPGCVASHYIRHEANGERTVTREAYAEELKGVRAARPGIRVAVYDHAFTDDSAWFRFTFKWPDPNTGEPLSQAGLQSYRIAEGKLAETWIALHPLGSSWPDAVAQENWTTPRKR